MKKGNRNLLKYGLLIITLFADLMICFLFVGNFIKSNLGGIYYKTIINHTLFSETSPDKTYTVKVCGKSLICSNNKTDTKENDVYCILLKETASCDIVNMNFDVTWLQNSMKIKFDYYYTNYFNVYDQNTYTITVPYSEFT